MNRSALLLAAASASVASPALAVNYPLTFTAGVAQPTPAPVTTMGDDIITDTFTFTTTSLSTFSGSLTTRFIFGPDGQLASDMDFVSVFLNGISFIRDETGTDALETWSRPSTILQAGEHIVTVNYRVDMASADNGASYGGVFNLASAAPEPATWAMFVGAFGAIGATLRKRRKDPTFA
jgi:hypothetical protein